MADLATIWKVLKAIYDAGQKAKEMVQIQMAYLDGTEVELTKPDIHFHWSSFVLDIAYKLKSGDRTATTVKGDYPFYGGNASLAVDNKPQADGDVDLVLQMVKGERRVTYVCEWSGHKLQLFSKLIIPL